VTLATCIREKEVAINGFLVCGIRVRYSVEPPSNGIIGLSDEWSIFGMELKCCGIADCLESILIRYGMSNRRLEMSETGFGRNIRNVKSVNLSMAATRGIPPKLKVNRSEPLDSR
jgi:hypothetical protein